MSRWLLTAVVGFLFSAQAGWSFEFEPPTPQSDYVDWSGQLSTGVDTCAKWNPEFGYLQKCCAPTRAPAYQQQSSRRGRRTNTKYACAPERRYKGSFCDERTITQERYQEAVASGEISDPLTILEREIRMQRQDQAYCTVNTGFLAWGRAVVPTEKNRLELRRPERCANFGTDEMVALLEWVGREIAKDYPAPEYRGVKLIVGDISAPRGGCMPGRSGRRGHSSHTSGLDVDLAFLQASDRRPSENRFHRTFDAKSNWWLVKKMFYNPYVCVKAIFLDRGLIRKLGKVAAGDPQWKEVQPFIRHVKGHKNHYHVRIGTYPGAPGCPQLPAEDFDEEDWMHEEEPLEANLGGAAAARDVASSQPESEAPVKK